ncbi:MAG: glycosyltransferase [Vulcanimicrobiaceae bacterium]
MRILQVIEATLGGTRRYVEDVFEACSGRDVVNGIVYASARADDGFLALLERMKAAGWHVYHLDLRRAIDLRGDLARARELRSIFERFAPDVVHAHSSKAGAVARLANLGRRARTRLVYSPHAIAVHLGAAYVWIERVLATQLDVLCVVSDSERAEIVALGIVAERKIRVVKPTIRADRFEPLDRDAARSRLGYGAEPRIVSIGRLAEQKNPLGFLEIVRALRERLPQVRAVWVGDGELRAAMEARMAEFALEDCVTIAGWCDDVRPYIAAADAFVSASRYESFGYVTAEALAMGRPVVASAINGTIDIVTVDVHASLYPPEAYRAAADATARLLLDPTLAAEIASRGRRRVLETFSPANTQRELFATYEAALAPSSPTRRGRP